MTSTYAALLRLFGLASVALALWWALGDVARGSYSYAQDGLGAGEGTDSVPSPGTPEVPSPDLAAAPASSSGGPGISPATAGAAASTPVEHPIVVRDSAEAPALALDLPALAGAGAGALVASAAGAAVHALSRRRKGRLAKVLRAATPWAKLAVGTAVGAGLAAALSGAALPAALAYGLVAGVSAIAGRQLFAKPVKIAREE